VRPFEKIRHDEVGLLSPFAYLPMKSRFRTILCAAMCGLATTTTVASAQVWASWSLPNSCAGPVTGSFGSATVTYSGPYNGVQNAGLNQCLAAGSPFGFASQNYFSPSNVYSPTPTNASFIQFVNMAQLNDAGTAMVPIGTSTITFSQAVIDPYFAIISAGNRGSVAVAPTSVTYIFSDVFRIVSYNVDGSPAPFFGNSPSTYTLNSPMTQLVATEFSGVLQFKGTFTSLSFTVNNNDNWHGITVGALSTSTVPEPSTYALMAAGLIALGGVARRRGTR
jgi:hypothetical protein